MKEQSDIKWHAHNLDDVLSKLNTTIGGLTEEEATERLETYGYNEFEGEEELTPFKLLLQQFINPLVAVLIFAAFFSIFAGKVVDTIVVIVVIIANAIIGFYQEFKAEQSLEKERRIYYLIAEAILYSTDLKDFCEKSLKGIIEILGYEGSTLRIYDRNSRMLIPVTEVFSTSEHEPGAEAVSIDDPKYIFALTARLKRALIYPRFEDRSILAPFEKLFQKRGMAAN